MSNGPIKTKKSKRQLGLVDKIAKKMPVIMLVLVTIFYFVFFLLTYFAPLLWPDLIIYFPRLFYHSKEFHEFYDHKYRITKGETKIWIELIFFLINYLIFVMAALLTSFTNPGEIPNDKNWKINIPENIPSDVQEEMFAIALIKREEMLNNNRSLILEQDNNVVNGDNEILISYSYERAQNGKVRYCITCEKFKPDRAHHCKICKKCVLKQDHHCPWLSNCIGFNNYKYFLNTLCYGLVAITFFNWVFSDVIRFMILNEKIVNFKLIVFFSYYIFMIVLMMSLFIFCTFHLFISLKNYTTYEYITKVIRNESNNDSLKNVDGVDESQVSMFDIGCINNFLQVMGPNPLKWCLPMSPYRPGDYHNMGISFKINKRFEYEIIQSV